MITNSMAWILAVAAVTLGIVTAIRFQEPQLGIALVCVAGLSILYSINSWRERKNELMECDDNLNGVEKMRESLSSLSSLQSYLPEKDKRELINCQIKMGRVIVEAKRFGVTTGISDAFQGLAEDLKNEIEMYIDTNPSQREEGLVKRLSFLAGVRCDILIDWITKKSRTGTLEPARKTG